jgi:hypothetical protein
MPNAGEPERKRHSSGAWRALERLLTICRRVVARRWRSPCTAGA